MGLELWWLLILLPYAYVAAVGTKNVLFIIVDDLRPDLGVYSGDYAPTPVYPKMHTPSIDELAATSLLLTRAYVQFPLCGPNRSCLFTSRRPETTRVYVNQKDFRDAGNFTTLPQYFKQNGYHSLGMGKVFHYDYDAISWSERFFEPVDNYAHIEESWAAIPAENATALPLYDQLVAEHALQRMRDLAPAAVSGDQLFFMAVGFRKPHLSFIFPEPYMDLYPEEEIEMPLTQSVPVDFPEIGWLRCNRVCDSPDVMQPCQFNQSVCDEKTLELRRAYYSCISYIDELVGQLLTELEQLGLWNDTIVAFVGDHGWQLGEHNEWCKKTAFEESLHAPAMVRVPGLTDDGIVTTKMTEFVDIFPTIAEAAGLEPLSLCPVDSASEPLCSEGTSLLPLIEDPERGDWKQRVFAFVYRNATDTDTLYDEIMGYTFRNERFRYTEWVEFDFAANAPIWEHLQASELYDLELDPEETVNVVAQSVYAPVVSAMSDDLHSGWRDDEINQPE